MEIQSNQYTLWQFLFAIITCLTVAILVLSKTQRWRLGILGDSAHFAIDERLRSACLYGIPLQRSSSSRRGLLRDHDIFAGEEVFQIEKEAVLNAGWHYTLHISHFKKPGDYQAMSLAGFSIFHIMGKDRRVRTFFNVCRHRAYPITKANSGSSLVLGCGYHGWSYNTLGELVKAPGFEDVTGFDKENRGLWQVCSKMSEDGLIFVNFDEIDKPDFSSDLKILRSGISRNCLHVAKWTVENCSFNWKLIKSFSHGNSTAARTKSISRMTADFLGWRKGSAAQISPLTVIFFYPHALCWLSMTFVPLSAVATTVQFDLYQHNSASSVEVRNLRSAIETNFAGVVTLLEKLQRMLVSDELSGEGLGCLELQQHQKLLDQCRKVKNREVLPSRCSNRTQEFSQVGHRDQNLCDEIEKAAFNFECEHQNNSASCLAVNLEW